MSTKMRSPLHWLAAAATGLALALPGAAHAATRLPTVERASASTCHHISGPFHTKGAKILNADGQRYSPYGINLVNLARPLASTGQSSYDAVANGEIARVDGAAEHWCVNTVRIQISQANLVKCLSLLNLNLLCFSSNPNMLAIKKVANYALGRGLIVVLSLQTQTDPKYDTIGRTLTSKSIVFWRQMTKLYGTNPNVMFDLLNEPAPTGGWAHWRNSYTENGIKRYGMQEAAATLRSAGAQNVFWVEGPRKGSTLAQAWANRLRGMGPLAYSEHRPGGKHTAASWRSTFGYLAERDLAPVVEGEWAQYARTNNPWACWPDAPTAVPRWFDYLQHIHAGMVAHKLSRGLLLESDSFNDPTRLKSNWACRSGLNQGAGKLIQNWFKDVNGPPITRIGRVSRDAVNGNQWRIRATVFRGSRPWPSRWVQVQRQTIPGLWLTVRSVETNSRGRISTLLGPSGLNRRPLRIHVPTKDGYPPRNSPWFTAPPR